MEKKEILNRQQFLKRAGLGLCGCSTILCSASALAQDVQPQSLETPLDEKMQFTHKWVKRFFDILDKELDEPIRTRIMQENGRLCYEQSIHANYPTVSTEKFVAILQKHVGKDNCWIEGRTVYFNYVSNKRGLRSDDGYCLCPMVENGPAGLSGNYCNCSIGYVRKMFSSSTGQQVDVELLESLKRGGKRCRFKISLA